MCLCVCVWGIGGRGLGSVSVSVFDLCFLLSVGLLFVSNLVYFSTFLYYLCLCCDCNKCIYHSYTHSINIYINIYMNQPIWSVFVSGVPVHNRFGFVFITWKAVKSWPFDWKWKLRVLACALSWGLNVNHWLGAVILSLLAVFSLLWTHVVDQGLFSLSFFDPRCTSICSFIKVIRVLSLSIIWGGVEDARRKSCSLVECCFFTGMYDFACPHVGTQVYKMIFKNYVGLNVLLSAFGLLQSAF